MYPYPGRSQSQAPPAPQSGGPYHGRPISASQSPEQSRAVPFGPPMGASEYGGRQSLGPPPGHEDHLPWHAQHRRQHSNNAGMGQPGPPPPAPHEMREAYPPRRDHQHHRSDDYGIAPSQRFDDRPPYGGSAGRMSMDERHATHPSPSLLQQQPGGGSHSVGYGGPPPPTYSHPPSPSRRPLTPPSAHARSSNNKGNRAGMPWDPAATGPMSAPPSIVPRMQQGRDGMAHPAPPPLSQQHNSPVVPGLLGPAPPPKATSSSREGHKGHARLPSWGPHSSSSITRESPSGMNASSSPQRQASTHHGGSNTGNSHNQGSRESMARDPYYRGGENQTRGQMEVPRKRPASESPPHAGPPPSIPVPQSSPSQRGDVMSMSSILGPSSGGRASSSTHDVSTGPGSSSADKRRRVEGMSSSTVKSEQTSGSAAAVSSAPVTQDSISASQQMAAESAAANLARRKWSGPIAEEAAQQAAAWRAQEQQRWGGGSGRSPKVGGMVPLAGGDRATPPFGGLGGRARGASPSVHEVQHRRQRSDGQNVLPPQQQQQQQQQHGGGGGGAVDARSPLARTSPLFANSPPSSASNLPLKATVPTRSHPSPQQGFHQPISPPPSQGILQHGQGPPPHMHQMYGPMGTGPGQKPPSMPTHLYNQPSYHAYDSQGRPVEIDVDEVRGGVYAGHGNAPPPHMMDPVYHHGMPPGYDEPPHPQGPPPHMPQAPLPPPPPQAQIPSRGKPSMNENQQKQEQKMLTQKQQQQAKQEAQSSATQSKPSSTKSNANRALPTSTHSRDRDHKVAAPRRSMTPVMPGPAKGLLPPRVTLQQRNQPSAAQRPSVPSKDFNQGPRVDNEAVWAALDEYTQTDWKIVPDSETEGRNHERDVASSGEAAVSENAAVDMETRQFEVVPHAQHLGSFLYDARRTPLLPGELLRRNVGATVEVRISGQAIGSGPQLSDSSAMIHPPRPGRWSLGPRSNTAQLKERTGPEGVASAKSESALDEQTAEGEASAFWDSEALLKRKVWGTDVYTDDSDIVAMCLHAGWITGPMLYDVPDWVPPGKAVAAWRRMTRELSSNAKGNAPNGALSDAERLESASVIAALRAATCDLSVVLRVAPKLIAYKGSQRSGVRSRSWGNTHDGVSFVIESVSLQRPGYASGERGLRSTKQRIDQLARLKMLATIAGDGGPHASGTDSDDEMRQEPQQQQHMSAGGLLDILAAAKLGTAGPSAPAAPADGRTFWQVDVAVDAKAA